MLKLDDLRVSDHAFWSTYPSDVYRSLRAESPVHYCESEGVWLITKYEDIKFISRNPDLFPSGFGFDVSTGFHVNPHVPRCFGQAKARGEFERARTGGNDNVIGSDGTRHRWLRRIFSSAFTPRALSALNELVERLTKEMIDRIEPGVEVNFVDAVAAEVPMRVMAMMLGVPDSDINVFRSWSDAIIDMRDVSLSDEKALAAGRMAMDEFTEYFKRALADRRRNPREDLLTALVTPGEEALSEGHQLTAARLLLLAGNETTRGLIANAGELLCRHPEQRLLLAKHPDMIPQGVEEFLRFAPPVKQMARTAIEDTELRGQRIPAGDYVVLAYSSGNRDEDIWADPDRFDVTRVADPAHVAFGFGEHFCMGAWLARREAMSVLSELLEHYPSFELTGDIERMESYMVPGIQKMPVVFGPRVR
jgi:cytochrome P450